MSRTPRSRRLTRATTTALGGLLAAACLLPGAASAAAPPAIPRWTMGAQNGALAFSTSTQRTGTIWRDGTHAAPIKQDGDDVFGTVSAWSSDGNRVLITPNRTTLFDVNPWTGKLVESATESDSDPNAAILGPSVSPDGLTYAWGTPRAGVHIGNPYDGFSSFWLHAVAGTGWSGSDRLAFINDEDEHVDANDDPGIYVQNGASETPRGDLHFAAPTTDYPQQVSLSANGTRLAYHALDQDSGKDAIYVSSAENSSTPRTLEPGGMPGAQDRFAAIAPDGARVAFASDRSGAWAIWTANWDGTGATKVPNTTLADGERYTGLAWQPAQVPDLAFTEISSATEVGSTLSLDMIGGEIGSAPLETSYSWQQCDDGTNAGCVDTGVTTATFPVTRAHLGHRYRVVRTVTNPAGTDTLASEITEAISEPPPADTDPPAQPTFGEKPASRSNDPQPRLTWTGAEPGGTYACSLDGAAFTACTSPQVPTLTGEGPHSFRVRQIDAAQNLGAIVEHAWTFDATPPATPVVTAKPPAATQETSARIAFTGDEQHGGFECRLGSDGAAWSPCSSPVDITGLAEGDKRFSVRQVDEAGNASDPAIVTWKVDRTAPAQPTVTTDLRDVVTTTTLDVAFTGETGGTFECRLDSATFVPCTTPATLTGLTTGQHTFSVRQTDAAGNRGDARDVPFTVDVTGPAKPTITDAPAASVKTPKVAFAFTGAESDGSGFECSIDGVRGWAACQSGVEVDGLPEGTYAFRVRQVDAHGNRGEAASRTWTYDATPPAKPTLIGDLDVVRTHGAEIRFRGEGPEGAGTFQCRLDQGAWVPCSSPAGLPGLTAGPHAVEVREIDVAGNVGAATEDAFTVDFTGPATPEATGGPKRDTRETTATLTFDGADPDGSGFECRLDDGAWAACASPHVLTDLTDGPHVAEVRQLDRHGNPGDVLTYRWTVDRTGPAAPAITTRPEPRTLDTAAEVDGTLAEPHGTVEHALDGGGWSTTTLPLRLTDLAVGEHVLLVRQTDAAGNHGEPARIAWTILAPPQPATPEQPAAPAKPATPAPAAATPAPATTAPAAAPTSAPKLTIVGGAGTGGGTGTASAATITVRKDGVGVGCAITGTVLTSCKVDLYADAPGRAASRAAGDRRVLVGTGEYRRADGSARMTVAVTLNATGRALLRRSPRGLKVAVAITGRPVKGEPLKATGAATLVPQRTTAVVGGFAINRATLVAAAKRQLTALAQQVRGTAVAVRVVGHTDGSSTDADYLKGLGLRRARTVAAFLRAHGVKAKATLVSRGATQPRATNATAAGRAANRRVELRIDR
ncbi:OmpA family protein [Patulibacter sp. SYSU D01012]|uniref:OmpA family protein n=1 Tax=Patulibacter sp. SYSU D01012 TaxID=2817381 RepID=UPI001B30E477|nr:OmpA family protein [Patulibacter sp. SYSU D01012]